MLADMLHSFRRCLRARVALTVIALVALSSCAGEQLVFPDWTIDVPAGIPVHGYAGVARAERTDRVELVEDLVLAPTDPEIAFYRAWRFDVDGDDNIYIADDGHKHVIVFDRDGNYLRRFGREGSGPGEFVSSQDVYVSGDRVVLGDWRGRRINVWDLRGNRIDEIEHGSMQLVDIPGRPWSEDSFIATTIVDDRRSEYDAAIERYDFELQALTRYLVYTATRNIAVGDARIHDPSVRIAYAVERGGNVYFTRGDRVQVLAYSGDGAPAWAARTTWPAPPFDDDLKRRIMETYYNPDGMTLSSRGWPDTIATVSRLAVDDAGRLWVYLREGYDDPPLDQEVPVDIFDRNGERLCACLVANRYWQAAGPGYVLALDRDPVTEEYIIVRYRVELPF
jgi:hypothetical protein